MLENKIKLYFRNREKVTAVYMFGSHAAGKERAGSDIDIAILFQTRDLNFIRDSIDLYIVDLSRLLKKDIHPIVLNSAGEVLLKQIFKKGKCIVVNDPRHLALFRVAAYAKIFDFSNYNDLIQSGLIKSVKQG